MALHSGKDSTLPPVDCSEGGGGSVVKNVRREFSARTKREAWSRANGYCEGVVGYKNGKPIKCNAPLGRGGFHYDHIDPDWFSKDNELENAQVLCHLCHRLKTKIDITAIAKSKRIIDKRTKVHIAKRPFAGWRNFRGEVVYAKRR